MPRRDRFADQMRAQLRHLEQDLETLHGRVTRAAQATVPASSPLAADNLASPVIPMSTIAVMSISSGLDHMRLSVGALVQGQHSIGHYTLVRAALLAVSRALYVLAPDHALERQVNSLWLLKHDLTQAGLMNKGVFQPVMPAAVYAEQSAYFRGLVDQVNQALRDRGSLQGDSRGPSDGSIIDAAADVMSKTVDAASVATFGFKSTWHMNSGYAHSYSWMRELAEDQLPDLSGSGGVWTSLDLGTLVPQMLMVRASLEKALDLYELRSAPAE